MIQTLRLQGYRGFESFSLSNLKRVNLLVGKNNCGKTSILEAMNFLVSKGNPIVLTGSAHRRGETGLLDVTDSSGSYARDVLPDISHLFFGRRMDPGVNLQISSNEDIGRLVVELLSLPDVEDALSDRAPNGVHQTSLFEDETDSEPALGLRVSGNVPDWLPIFPVTENGLLSYSGSARLRRFWSSKVHGGPPFEFLTPDSLQPGSMRVMWDKVLAEGREPEVINAMKLLESDIDSIHFLTGESYRRTSGGVLVGFGKSSRRIPLGSMGDGMRRLLALSLSLVRTGDGYLLIDEIDTGLHFSVMEEMWKLVVNTALQSNVQIFATTHSYDCIRGLADLVESSPSLASEVSVQKIENTLAEAVSLDAEQVRIAVRQDLEVR